MRENLMPDKLWECLELAMADLEKSEKDPRIKIDMYTWLDHNEGEPQCLACLAGCVMAQRFCGVPEEGEVCETPYSVGASYHDSHRLMALDHLKSGSVYRAVTSVYDYKQVNDLNRDVENYADDPALFKSQMQQLVQDLKSNDL